MQKLPPAVREFIIFGLKQAYACLFGGILLIVIIATKFISIPHIHRYDLIFICAIITQTILIATKLETKKEVLMIAAFHIIATVMEIFKTSGTIGSWTYPGEAFFHVANVPLFAGFMYSAVGSYLARVWNIFSFRFTSYPKFWITCVVAGLIYINFFSHHYIFDIRILLFIAIFAIYARTWIYYTVNTQERRMPLLLGLALVSLFIWFAENIGTYVRIWLYPSQLNTWHLVSYTKLGAWFLLMFISFVLISIIHQKKLTHHTPSPTPTE